MVADCLVLDMNICGFSMCRECDSVACVVQGTVSTLTNISDRLKTVEISLPQVESELRDRIIHVEDRVSNLIERQEANFKLVMAVLDELRTSPLRTGRKVVASPSDDVARADAVITTKVGIENIIITGNPNLFCGSSE